MLRRPTDDGFTERFQYLVASSGLLEKTQILSLVSAQEEDNPPVPPEADDKLQMIVQSQQHRWDIYAASAFVIVSVLYVLGLSMLLVPSAAVAGGAALLLPSKSDSTSEMAKAPQVDSTEAAKEEPKPSEDSTTRVFNTLNALLAESRNLDQAIGTAMSLLAPRPDDLESGHSLRIALHRLFSDMTDSLAGTTSTLIPMADRSELAVLGDMYDIPVLGNRRRRASSSGSEGSTTTPVPHRQRSLSTSEAVTMGDDPSTPAAAAPDANDRFTPLPVRQLRHKRSESRGFDHSPAASPLRPYHSQHQREASVETRGNDGDEAMSVASSSTESSSLAPSSLPEQLNGARPPVGPASRAVMMSFTPKRASPLAHTGHTGHSLERPDAAPSSFPANAAPSSFPASARTTSPTSFHMRPSQSPFRRSLQDIPYIHTPPSSSAEQAAELAKARATSNMSSAKRRSLQTPYNLDLQREQTLVEANAGGLTRASSLQYTNRSAHSDALAALEGKRNVTEPVRSGLRPLTMSASLSTPNKRASSIWNTQISPPKSTPQQQVVESKSRNRNSIILESGSAGTAAMAQSEAMSSRRSSTTLEGQTLLSSPDGSAASKRSSLLLDQGPAGKRVQQLLGEQNALGLGHSPRSASLGVHQPFQRVPSISPLTLGGLKASCHGVHLKRRRVACCLLGLRFAEPRSSSYWDDVCGEMQKLTEAMAMGRESLDSAREEAEKELSAQRALAESAKRHSSPAAPLGNIDDGPVEFAPRSDPMLSSVDELQRTLARVWARCDELRQRGVTLEPDILASIWADVRSDVGGMLRQVERGREAVRSTNVSEAGATDPTDSEIMPISASSADMEPGFLRAWEAVDQEEDEIERLVSGEDVPPDSEPYQEFLPPPGIDEVFEAAIPPAPAPRPKATLSRDERIKAAKEARARGAAMDRLTANSKEPPPEPEVRGQVMQELEGVFGVIRQRKGYSRQPAPESPATVPKESKPDSTPDSRISTPNSTPASARVTTPQSTSSAPRLVASPSRSPTVLSPVQPQFGLPQPQFGLPRIGSPTFRVTSPTSGRIGSPTPSSRVTSPTPSSRVSSPPPTAWSPRSAPRVLSPTSARMVSPPPGRMATMSPPLKSPSPISPRALSPTGPHTPSRSPSLSRQSSLTRASSLTRPGASGARKQKGMSLQPIAATVPLATSPDAERRRSLQTLYEGSNASGEFKPIHLRAPEEVAEDEIGVAL